MEFVVGTEAGERLVGACGWGPVETGLITTMGLAKEDRETGKTDICCRVGGGSVYLVVGFICHGVGGGGIYLWWGWWCWCSAVSRPVGWS